MLIHVEQQGKPDDTDCCIQYTDRASYEQNCEVEGLSIWELLVETGG